MGGLSEQDVTDVFVFQIRTLPPFEWVVLCLHDFPSRCDSPLSNPITVFSTFPNGRGVSCALSKIEAFSLQSVTDEAVSGSLLFFWNLTPKPILLLTSASLTSTSHSLVNSNVYLFHFARRSSSSYHSPNLCIVHFTNKPHRGYRTIQHSTLPTIRKTPGANFDLKTTSAHHLQVESPEQEKKVPGSDPLHSRAGSTGQSNSLQDPAIQYFPAPIAPQRSVGYLRPGKTVPPRIDAVAANQPFLQVGDFSTPTSEYSHSSDGQSTAPFSPNTQITTPSSMFSRKPSLLSSSPNPPSPNLASNLECAFPPLPVKSNQYKGDKGASMNNSYAPLSPRPQGGAEVLQRMNTIASGPFGHRARPSQERLPIAPRAEAPRAHSRTGSMKQQFRNEQGRQHFRKASTASSVRSQGSQYSQQSQDIQTHLCQDDPAFGNHTRPSEAIDKFLDELQSEPSLSPIKSLESIKARTFLRDTEDRPKPKFIGAGLPPPPSAPHYRTEFSQRGLVQEKRPGTSAGGMGAGYGGFSTLSDPAVQNAQPLHESYSYDQSTPTGSRRPRSRTVTQPLNSSSYPQIPQFERPRAPPLPPGENFSAHNMLRPGSRERTPVPARDPVDSGATRARSRTITRPLESKDDVRTPIPHAPAFPTLNRLMTDQPVRSEMCHSPSDSGSSGYASTGRSTPPSSVGSSISRSGSTDSTNERHWDGGALKSATLLQPNNLPRPRIPASSELYKAPESPVDPAIQKPRLPNASPVEFGSRNMNSDFQPRRLPDVRPFPSAATAATAFNRPVPSKNNCAACQQPISGKSIKAAGGKLTGRYHKGCFACRTCQAPFPTAEFYVLNDAPYCGRHYHELNGSLCRKCDSGIEGQYLQTDRREKYHAHCFSCMECRVRLTEDYFEVNGQPFCERHAYSMTRNRGPQYGNSSLGVYNANRPEKRRTRLMMM
ncbi:hypothetical protein FKW77_005103 [Venturia effusa]|uniref:LIM zinc-binding domain-containing protein n=1 Tax=Venturia effusa TaxID=50376 RepID=A0A517LNW8_9PEZI|nr:hypothetical protein FKW77_005103 [Venturia effusa]